MSYTILSFLANLLGLEINFIEKSIKLLEEGKGYNIITIPKSGGRKRIIHSPDLTLKVVQEKLLLFLYSIQKKYDLWDFKNMFGGIPNKNLMQNATFHIMLDRHSLPKYFLKIDLKNAFPSVKSNTLKPIFKKLVEVLELDKKFVAEEIADLLIKLTTINDQMPQGAPTSPYLLNIVLVELGIIKKIQELCKKEGCIFSVYVDDIIVSKRSTGKFPYDIIGKITGIIEKSNVFKVNQTKTTVIDTRRISPSITGIVLTDKNGKIKTTLRQRKQNELRRIFFYATKLLESGIMPTEDMCGFSLFQVQGYLAWVKQATGNKPPARLKSVIEEFELALKKFDSNKSQKVDLTLENVIHLSSLLYK